MISVQEVIYQVYQRKGNQREEYFNSQAGFKSQLIQGWGQAHE